MYILEKIGLDIDVLEELSYTSTTKVEMSLFGGVIRF